ncbi:DNA ligase 1 [Topomyia yanbarensis]|uniref:DNA ligase 1 n=1 Tax=Topomyia yanbarensis TaxID=2498891 RepID=UPI00273C27CD|nr:DNA ligase 1 [Topomyia yanbarensis]XP_058811346.1 DNA ligase 1 [Topomyia yanbarensis]
MVHSMYILTTVLVLMASVEVNGDDVDFRAFDFGDEDTEFFSPYEKAFSDHEYFPTDFNLEKLDLISAVPKFTKKESYVSPSEVEVARAKRKAVSSDEQSNEEDDDDEETNERADNSDDYADRYERFVSRHFRDRDEDNKDTGAQYEYHIDFNPSDDYERIKQESEAQSRQLAKDPENCKAYEQDGMLCHACKDPATDTTSESCSYATAPHHKKFAYVKQKNYNSNDHEKDEPEEDDRDEEDIDEDENVEDSSQRKRVVVESVTKKPHKPKVIPTKKSVVHTKPGQDSANGGGYRYQPVDLRSNKKRPQPIRMQPAEGKIAHPTYYDFYTHLFPSHGQSQKMQQQEPADSDNVYVLSYRDKEEMAKVLADFATRDWSNCKKATKNELTCYTCTDKDGVKHEECMYVSESHPSPQVLPSTTTSTSTASLGSTTLPADAVIPKPTKRPQRKKVTSEKKSTAPKPSRKQFSEKLIQRLEPSEQDGAEVLRTGQDRQTVKRTVTIKSHVDGTGRDAMLEPLQGDRVVHYEHHVTHLL